MGTDRVYKERMAELKAEEEEAKKVEAVVSDHWSVTIIIFMSILS